MPVGGSLAVVVGPVLIDHDHEAVDKLIDLCLFLFDQLLVGRHTVAALHVHNSDVSDGSIFIVRALDAHDCRDVLILQLVIIKEGCLSGVKIACNRLPAIVF